MSERRICPSCGFNLEAEEIVEIGVLRFDPAGPAQWNGVSVHLTKQQRIILGALVDARGRFIRREMLESRVNYEGPHGLVFTQIFKLRQRFHRVGADFIRFETGAGYRIDVAACEAAA